MNKRLFNLSDKTMMRILVVLCVILALVGGYFHAQLLTQKRRYTVLRDKYDKLLDLYESEDRK